MYGSSPVTNTTILDWYVVVNPQDLQGHPHREPGAEAAPRCGAEHAPGKKKKSAAGYSKKVEIKNKNLKARLELKDQEITAEHKRYESRCLRGCPPPRDGLKPCRRELDQCLGNVKLKIENKFPFFHCSFLKNRVKLSSPSHGLMRAECITRHLIHTNLCV